MTGECRMTKITATVYNERMKKFKFEFVASETGTRSATTCSQ